MDKKKSSSLKQAIAAAYSNAANTYDAAAFVEQQIGLRLLEKLSYTNLQPLRILDLGCGTGHFIQQLSSLFPTAHIIATDIAHGMVNFARNKYHSESVNFCTADAESLPYNDRCFDLIFANCCFTAREELPVLYNELHRCLKIGGVLLFSTFGPDSLRELGIDGAWLDMHILGDALVHAQLKDPVLDVEHLTFTYPALRILLEDLHNTGSYAIDDLYSIPNLDTSCSTSFEVIYGFAWGKEIIAKQIKDQHGNILIDPKNIKVLNN